MKEAELPDGTILEFPADTPDEVIQRTVKSRLSAPQSAAPKQPQPSITERFMRGMADPFNAGAQMLEKALPSSLSNAINRADQFLYDKTGGVVGNASPSFDQALRDSEQAYQERRGPDAGIDWARIGGNVLNPANLAIGAKIPQAATLSGKVLAGALAGGATGLTQPATSENKPFSEEKIQQALMGAAGGGLAPVVGAGLSRVISPKASKNQLVQQLRSEGVNPTVGQTLGGWVNRLEEKAQSIPIMGDAIQAARQRAGGDLERAAINRSLAKVDAKLPEGLTGNDAILFARKTLGNEYDKLLPQMTLQADNQFINNVGSLRSMVQQGAISPNASRQFERFMANEVEPMFQGQAAMTGDTLKRLQSKITEQIQRTQASTNADERLLSDAYKELGGQLQGLSVRSNPKLADQLSKINEGWANFKRLQRASASVGAEGGSFTPSQLHSAVKAADRSKDKARFAEGNALMQDLSSAGKQVLSNKVPDSGTAQRLMLGAGGLASGLVNPAIPVGLVGGAAIYTPQFQKALVAALTQRPESAQNIAAVINQASPMLSPAFGATGTQMLGQ